MRRVGVIYNPLSESSSRGSEELTTWLRRQGLDVWRGVSREGRDDPAVIEGEELLIAMGGDGTILRAARLAIPQNIPVLGIALGRLSFMAELSLEEARDGLTRIFNGEGWLDERALLRAELQRDGRTAFDYTALNEVVISRSHIHRVITVEVEIDGAPLTHYHADGVIISTATGSTAYALAAGGPIIDPRSRALLLVAVAAHLTNVPSMVLSKDATATLRLASRHPASLAIDGRDNIQLEAGDELVVRRSNEVCRFVRVHPPSEFYARLITRLRGD